MSNHEDDQALRDAQATAAADQIRRSMADGTMTFSDYPPEQAEKILASTTPEAEDLAVASVPTSVRLPYELHQRLRAYATAHDTTASTLIREWVEQMLTPPDTTICVADAVRALYQVGGHQPHQPAA